MTPSPSLPVRQVFERWHTEDCLRVREMLGEPLCSCPQPYTATPSPGLEWVVRCVCEHVTYAGGERLCTCEHSTQTWVSVPSGAVGVGLVKGGSLHAQGVDGGWVPQDLVEPWRGAWEEIGPVWTDARKDEGEIVAPPNGLIFLCEREEECGRCGGDSWTKLDQDGRPIGCHECSATGTLRRWVLERGVEIPSSEADWIRRRLEKGELDGLKHYPDWDVLMVFPTPESRDAGRLDEAGQIERRYLG